MYSRTVQSMYQKMMSTGPVAEQHRSKNGDGRIGGKLVFVIVEDPLRETAEMMERLGLLTDEDIKRKRVADANMGVGVDRTGAATHYGRPCCFLLAEDMLRQEQEGTRVPFKSRCPKCRRLYELRFDMGVW